MARRELTPDDYEFNSDFLYDIGHEIVDPDGLYDCSLCAAGKCKECQKRWSLCKCFYNDHEEAWG